MNANQTVACKQCARRVDTLAVFPGGLCLDCYRPEGERLARTMTADKLAAMWGGKVRKTQRRKP